LNACIDFSAVFAYQVAQARGKECILHVLPHHVRGVWN